MNIQKNKKIAEYLQKYSGYHQNSARWEKEFIKIHQGINILLDKQEFVQMLLYYTHDHPQRDTNKRKSGKSNTAVHNFFGNFHFFPIFPLFTGSSRLYFQILLTEMQRSD